MTSVHAGRGHLAHCRNRASGYRRRSARSSAARAWRVIFKMRVAKLALQPAELGEDTMQSRIIDTAAGEGLVKLTLFR